MAWDTVMTPTMQQLLSASNCDNSNYICSGC